MSARNVDLLRIGAARQRIRDAIARLESRDAGTDLDHDAGRFGSRRERHRQRVEARAVVDIDVVHADRLQAHAHLSGAQGRRLHFRVRERLDRAGRRHSNRVYHSVLLLKPLTLATTRC
jgi:hypothetical protein